MGRGGDAGGGRRASPASYADTFLFMRNEVSMFSIALAAVPCDAADALLLPPPPPPACCFCSADALLGASDGAWLWLLDSMKLQAGR